MTIPSHLVAVLLVINSFSGSNLVFHFPPCPDTNQLLTNSCQDIDILDGLSSDETESIEEESFVASELSDGHGEEGQLEDTDKDYIRRHPWDNVLGFNSDFLADLLTPCKTHCGKKFELWVDELVFLGLPIHIRSDGTWSKQTNLSRYCETNQCETFNMFDLEVSGVNESQGESIDPSQHQMTLFHIVVAMKLSLTQNYHAKINEMYTNVVTKLAMALKYEQARTNYVWSQSEIILQMREKAVNDGMSFDALWADILFKSSLASALATVYNAISVSGIAHLTINNSFDLSIFIPTPIITSSIPTDVSENNCFLTSVDVYDDDMDYNDPFLTPHSSLLLLDDVESVLQNIPADANPCLSLFVKNIRPTQTLLKLSQQINIPLKTIHVLAEHLIYWRRAIPIPPINMRNIYFVSPAANMAKLKYQESMFRMLFPTIPSLSSILEQLSKELHPFSFYIPSKSCRGIYLNVLTWLIRYGWVCQLKTFIWIRVSKEIKEVVLNKQKQGHISSIDSTSFSIIDNLTDSIIREPHQASKLERAWIEEIISRKPLKYAILFNRIIKYFNGKNALEKISSLEGIPRKDIRELLQVFENNLEKTYFW
ncbi:hypothetical protein T552_03402 [Pneumocystis carinii B80]|uniref:Nitrogen permease regulator 3 n=1 Tax=Pneumocystis carinii (strain B80) TaxID=1408658 RepID=A0A0W4ZBQ4_PNEC8|nr:hypothetical protein T552_03402 [Pneumocystis carinii B80]KTW25789.1 hypothetical protein T552_03402 [Pneumocystis carinii B80]